MSRKIELLAPAKNLETGIAAIRHGADAVYIGAENFGARTAASNSMQDIEKLVQYAHQYNAKIYLTLNYNRQNQMYINFKPNVHKKHFQEEKKSL